MDVHKLDVHKSLLGISLVKMTQYRMLTVDHLPAHAFSVLRSICPGMIPQQCLVELMLFQLLCLKDESYTAKIKLINFGSRIL